MKLIRRLKFLLNIRKSIPLLYEFFTYKGVTLKKKAVAVLFLIGYAIFPYDAIPDFLVIFGFLDDVVILTFVLQQIIKMAPEELRNKYGTN